MNFLQNQKKEALYSLKGYFNPTAKVIGALAFSDLYLASHSIGVVSMIGTEMIFQLIDTTCVFMILVVELAQFFADKREKAFNESIAEISLPTMVVDTHKTVQ